MTDATGSTGPAAGAPGGAEGRGGLGRFDLERLAALAAAFGSVRVAVVGDFFLDKYLEVDPGLEEVSLETGLAARQVVAVRHSPGAAGTVVSNLASLGAGALRAIGFTGEDGEGWELRRDLAALGCDASRLHVDAGRRTPTYLKPRDRDRPGLAGEHGRYDTKNRLPTPAWLEDRILASIDEVLDDVDALVVMDQVEDEGAGVLTPGVVEGIVARVAARPGLVAWADSRRRVFDFRGLALKMNQFELVGLHEPEPGSSVPDSAIASVLPEVTARAGAPIFATAAERGVWVAAPPRASALASARPPACEPSAPATRTEAHARGRPGWRGVGGSPPERVPAVAVEGPVDPTGAGDSFTAGAVLALASGASLAEAALVGNLVASITVRRLGETGVAKPEELGPALGLWKERNS